jgi:uncharacterized membrane protein
MRRLPWILALALASGCGEETAPLEADCGPEVPIESWATFGRPFLTTHCQGCHASTSTERYDAPPDVVFDTHEDASSWKDRILARAGGDSPTMPPQGGTSVEDRERLQRWVTCFEGR